MSLAENVKKLEAEAEAGRAARATLDAVRAALGPVQMEIGDEKQPSWSDLMWRGVCDRLGRDYALDRALEDIDGAVHLLNAEAEKHPGHFHSAHSIDERVGVLVYKLEQAARIRVEDVEELATIVKERDQLLLRLKLIDESGISAKADRYDEITRDLAGLGPMADATTKVRRLLAERRARPAGDDGARGVEDHALLMREVADLRAALDKLLEERAKAEHVVDAITRERNMLRAEVDVLKSHVVDEPRLHDEVDAAHAENEELRAELAGLRDRPALVNIDEHVVRALHPLIASGDDSVKGFVACRENPDGTIRWDEARAEILRLVDHAIKWPPSVVPADDRRHLQAMIDDTKSMVWDLSQKDRNVLQRALDALESPARRCGFAWDSGTGDRIVCDLAPEHDGSHRHTHEHETWVHRNTSKTAETPATSAAPTPAVEQPPSEVKGDGGVPPAPPSPDDGPPTLREALAARGWTRTSDPDTGKFEVFDEQRMSLGWLNVAEIWAALDAPTSKSVARPADDPAGPFVISRTIPKLGRQVLADPAGNTGKGTWVLAAEATRDNVMTFTAADLADAVKKKFKRSKVATLIEVAGAPQPSASQFVVVREHGDGHQPWFWCGEADGTSPGWSSSFLPGNECVDEAAARALAAKITKWPDGKPLKPADRARITVMPLTAIEPFDYAGVDEATLPMGRESSDVVDGEVAKP